MLIHIFADTPHHYLPMQKFFSEQCSVDHKQEFWVKAPINNKGQLEKSTSSTVSAKAFKYYRNAKELVLWLTLLPKSARIIFHGLADVHVLRRLLFSSLVKRCSCVIWGYELYRYQQNKRSIKLYITQLIHKLVFKRINKVITLTPGDGVLVTHILKRQSSEVLAYPLIGVLPMSKKSKNKNANSALKILVGNSAAKSNEHIEAFKQLANLAGENIEIIVPLNYASSGDYREQVITAGQNTFSDKFTPITTMLNKTDYDALLSDVDMTVFAHQRQQGLYVAYSMLLMGKPIFLRSDTSSYQNFSSLGFGVSPLANLVNTSFIDLVALADKPNKSNQALMNNHFTEQALAPKWSQALNDLFHK